MNANRLGILVVVSAIAAQTLLLQSCSSFLEEYSQDNDYVRTWNDLDELLIGNCYMPVVEGEAFSAQANYGSFLHYLADELEENNTPYMGKAAAYDERPVPTAEELPAFAQAEYKALRDYMVEQGTLVKDYDDLK